MNTILVQNTRNKVDPKIFALLLSCASMVMVFMAFTSAYIVRQAAGNWLEFRLPNQFFVSTLIIALSSVTIHLSYRGFLNYNSLLYRVGLVVTMVLGVAFMVSQYFGWQQLVAMGVELNTNPSGSFVYIISGMHVLHVFGGVGVLLTALIHSVMLQHKVTYRRTVRFKLTMIYWHFVDLLWIYLLVFFMIQMS